MLKLVALLMLFSYSGPILMYNEFEKKMQGLEFMSDSRCLKTIEKVSFNIQRLHQEWTKVQCYQKGQFQLKKKMVRNAQISKFKCDIFE